MTTAAVQGTLPEAAGKLSISISDPRGVGTSHQDDGNEEVELTTSNSIDVAFGRPQDDTSTSLSAQERTSYQASATETEISRIPYSSDEFRHQPQMDGIVDYPTVQQSEVAIDSALLAGLRDPRERLGLLKLEKAMIDFMNTSDGYIEVGGPYNSVVISPTAGLVAGASANPDRPQTTFQRCILHRLADRFSIARETGTLVDGYIRLVKLKDSKVPKKLLLHLEPSEYNAPVDEAARSMEQISISGQGTSNNQNSVGAANSKPKQRKMKIMKRNSSCSSNGSAKNSNGGSGGSRSTPRKSKNLSDREKAYAEARARIFSDQQSDGGTGPNTPVASAAPSPTTTPPVSRGGGGSNNSLEDFATAEEYDGRARMSNAAAPKATWRNRREEENDPDFQRGGAVVVQQSYGGDTYGGYGAGGGTSFPQHSSQQHNFYPTYTDDRTPYYGGQGQASQHQAQQGYYASQGRGRGRGFVPNPRYGNYGNNNYYHHNNHYNHGRGSHAQPANVNSLDDFPSLR